MTRPDARVLAALGFLVGLGLSPLLVVALYALLHRSRRDEPWH